MNKALLLFVSMFAMALPAWGQKGIHGMVIFGNQVETVSSSPNIYISHLPFLHGAHLAHAGHYVAEIELDQASRAAYLEHRKENPELALYTVQPLKPFDRVKDLGTIGFKFPGHVLANHFENPPGYAPSYVVARNAEFTVKRIVVMYELKTKAALKDAQPLYSVFGNAVQQFAVNHFISPPDYQHIVEVKVAPALTAEYTEQDGFFKFETPLSGFTIPQTLDPDAFQRGFAKPKDGHVYQLDLKNATGSLELVRTNFFYFNDLRGF